MPFGTRRLCCVVRDFLQAWIPLKSFIMAPFDSLGSEIVFRGVRALELITISSEKQRPPARGFQKGCRPDEKSLVISRSKSLQAEGKNPTNDTYTVTASVAAGRITGFRLEVLEAGDNKFVGRHDGGFFVERGLFRQDEVDAARAALERLYDVAQTQIGRAHV